ncbi:hypothetical protein [Pyxidicoccus sp. MSG2]|uniref:hypothetical protein n=1 Tax=Pyxidicoccus sp. MSG2 TaxID=2996790 RepID=UPI0022711D6C|nr:hypothetical protein [Pyxidicoccus sp. MSG2]MCY1015771.1 hypothetical protein [Pyxidicoccus sp. MSG2]
MVKITRPPAPQLAKVDAPMARATQTAAPAAAPAPARPDSSMEAARPSVSKAPAQQKLEQQLATFAEGPIRQALQQALSGALSAPIVGVAARAISGFSPAQQKELSTLLSKAGVSAKASPRADAGAERAFLLKAISDGAVGTTLKRLADQIRGRPPGNQAFSFNPMSASATKSKATAGPVDTAAAKLKAAMDDIWGTDEAAVFEALEGTDPALLPQVAQKYEKLTGTSLRDALELELEGPDLKRALAALDRPVTAAPTAPAAPTGPAAPVQAPVKAAAVAKASAADIQKNLDGIKVTSHDEGTIKRGNAVELNLLIPINVATWKPPKAKVYNPLKEAVKGRNEAQQALDKATTDTAKKAAQAKLEAADKKVAAEGDKVKAWLKTHIGSNPELQHASAEVKHAEEAVSKLKARHQKAKVPKDPVEAEALKNAQKTELDAANARLTTAQATEKSVKATALARVDAYQPMVDVPQTRSDITVDGTTVRMRDGRETAYTNSWKALDGGAIKGDSRTDVDTQLEKSGISEDRRKVLASISGLEGTFSKVNTWDIGRVSWGFTQWTLGKSGNGSLAEFMRDLKKNDSALYEKHFGRYGLGIDDKGVVLTRGDGTVLKGVEAAEAIRTDVKLSAVFMAAGAAPEMQQAQIKFANQGKISDIRNHPVAVTGKDARGAAAKGQIKLKDVVTSEYGNAIMTDLAVNAGTGMKKASEALAKYVSEKGVDPAKVKDWAADAEKAVIAALEQASRSERLTHHAKAGFSKEPNTFTD